MKYQVKIEAFEGPFDLLFSLITKQKIDIYDVSLTTIIRDYLDHMNKMRQFDLEIASEFLVIAATLLKIKAGSLIHSEQEEEVEELSPAEARDLLVAHLLEYKKFKNVAGHLSSLMEDQYGFCKRKGELEKRILARTDLLKGITIEDLAPMLVSALLKSKKEIVISTDHIISPPVNLNEKISFVLRRLHLNSHDTFRNLTKRCRTKMEAAVTFLALLELYRRRIVKLKQIETFGEIDVELAIDPVDLSALEFDRDDITRDIRP